MAGSAQVRGYDDVRIREFRHQRPPHVTGLRIAVQQYYRIAFPGDQVVQPHTVDIWEAAFRYRGGFERSRRLTSRHNAVYAIVQRD